MVRRDSPFGMRPQPALAPWLLRYARASTPAARGGGRGAPARAVRRGPAALRRAGRRGDRRRLPPQRLPDRARLLRPRHAEEEAASRHRPRARRARPDRAPRRASSSRRSPANCAAAVLFPDEAQCDPIRLVADVAAAAERAGAELRAGVEVGAIAQEPGGVRVGDIRAGHAVIAAGVWSARARRVARRRAPARGGQGLRGRLRLRRVAAADAVVPLRRPGRRQPDGRAPAPHRRPGPRPHRAAAATRSASAPSGAWPPPGSASRAEPRLTWSGLRPCTPDGLPVIGPHPRADRVVLATGHGMLGVTLGPLTGAARRRTWSSGTAGSPGAGGALPGALRLSPGDQRPVGHRHLVDAVLGEHGAAGRDRGLEPVGRQARRPS